MPQNLFDHLVLAPFDKTDDLLLAAALGTEQRVRLIHLFDQGGPAFPSFFGAGSGAAAAPG